MCGIVGILSNQNCIDSLISGLEKLEYRGYDSSGIALNTTPITIFKDVGKVKHLKEIINYDITSNLGIGHTRWATHGKPSKENSHPHISYNQRFALVHNGVIENYLSLKNKYLKDINFYSQTDTEVIVNLLSYLAEEYDVLTCLKKLNSLLIGSYALCIIDTKNKDTIYFMKKQTPLTIGFNEKNKVISSDSLAFNDAINQQILLDDGDYGYLNTSGIVIYDKLNQKVNRKIIAVEKEKKFFINNNFQYHMEKEIHDQVFLIDELINHYVYKNQIQINQNILNSINESDKIYIIACGSSFYSGNIGKYYFEHFKQIPVEIFLASEAIYDFPLLSKKPFFIFVSQSGETLDVLNFLKQVKEKNIPTLGITNSPNSTITHLCDDILYLYAGREISVASTKAFLGQCIIFLLLSYEQENIKQDLLSLKEEIKNILSHKNLIENFANSIKNYKDIFYLGRNLDYYISLEGALKLKELSYIHAEAFASGELKHGSLALLDEGTAVIGLNTQDSTSLIMRTNIMECNARGAKSFVISKKSLSKEKDHFIINDLPNYLIPLSELVVVQLLAFYTAKAKGNEVDMPRNLAKSVTVE